MTDLAHRPTYAEIDLASFRRNFKSCREFIGRDVKYMAVVKANAYGHGAIECSRALVSEGADWLGVAIVEEAIELRQADIKIPILCLGGFFPGQEDVALEYGFTPVVFNIEQANALDTAAGKRKIKARFHLKVDTGMGRLGIRWYELGDFIRQLHSLKNVQVEGLMSHLAAANDPTEDGFTNAQIDRLIAAESELTSAGFAPEIVDIANSPGLSVIPVRGLKWYAWAASSTDSAAMCSTRSHRGLNCGLSFHFIRQSPTSKRFQKVKRSGMEEP